MHSIQKNPVENTGGTTGGAYVPPKQPGELRSGASGLVAGRTPAGAMLCSRLISTRPQLASTVRRSDIQDRSPLIQSKEQQPRSSLIQLKEQQLRSPRRTTPSSSGRSASTLSGGGAHHKFYACFAPPTFYCFARLWWKMSDDHLAITLVNFFREKYLLAE